MALPDGRRLASLALAGGGVLLAHHLTYSLAGGHVSAGVEAAAAGHAYLRAATDLILALSVIGAAAIALPHGATGPTGRLDLARRIFVFQASTFLAMEVLERVFAGASVSDLAIVLPIGIAVQLPIAVAIAGVITWVIDSGRQLASTLARAAFPRVRSTPSPLVSSVLLPPVPVTGREARPRGPPLGR
jgi:hypothetical protein